jgi:hypothetical protein
MNVLNEGMYPFTVVDVITATNDGAVLRDKNGVDMAKLKLVVHDENNRERSLFTYLLGDGTYAFKLRHFANSVGMLDEYEQGVFNIHKTVGRSGYAEIVIKKGTMKQDGSGKMWDDRNDVKDFISKPNNTNHSSKAHSELNDDVPF